MAEPDPNARRVALALSCRDTDAIPKVGDAGVVREDGLQVMHNGVLVEADGYQGAWMTEIIRCLRGHHEPQEEVAFHAVLERLAATEVAPVVMELGAWWAYYSLWAKRRLPAARAFCIEPDPAYLEQGKRNFECNGAEAVFHHAAVAQHAAAPRPFLCESDGLEHDVAFESLPSLLARWGLERVDLLLVDVQGAETPLIDGGRNELRDGRVRFMIVSTHHHAISGDALTHQRCLMLLRELGAHVITEHTVAESFTGDGLIVVSFDERDRDLTVVTSRCRAGDSLFGDPLWDLDAVRAERDALVRDASPVPEPEPRTPGLVSRLRARLS